MNHKICFLLLDLCLLFSLVTPQRHACNTGGRRYDPIGPLLLPASEPSPSVLYYLRRWHARRTRVTTQTEKAGYVLAFLERSVAATSTQGKSEKDTAGMPPPPLLPGFLHWFADRTSFGGPPEARWLVARLTRFSWRSPARASRGCLASSLLDAHRGCRTDG